MNTKRIIISIGLLGVCLGLIALFGIGHSDKRNAFSGERTSASNVVSQVEIGETASFSTANRQDTTIKKSHPIPPPQISEWYNWEEMERSDYVTAAQHDTELSPEIVIFFKEALFDKNLDLVTRNNIANALIEQQAKDENLFLTFGKIVKDKEEDVQWRDYALQFLATSAKWSSNPSKATEIIWEIAREGEGTCIGTALLHLHYMAEQNLCILPIEYEKLIAKYLKEEKTEVSSRMTAISIVGERKIRSLKSELRLLITSSSEMAIRRTAISSLGKVGDQEDLDFIRGYVLDDHPLIAASARSAEACWLQSNKYIRN